VAARAEIESSGASGVGSFAQVNNAARIVTGRRGNCKRAARYLTGAAALRRYGGAAGKATVAAPSRKNLGCGDCGNRGDGGDHANHGDRANHGDGGDHTSHAANANRAFCTKNPKEINNREKHAENYRKTPPRRV